MQMKTYVEILFTSSKQRDSQNLYIDIFEV